MRDEIPQELEHSEGETIPSWPLRSRGLPYIPDIGSLKMKRFDWSKLFAETFQTTVWMGASAPSYKSIQRQLAARADCSGPQSRGVIKPLSRCS